MDPSVKFKDSLADLALVEQVVVLWRLFDRDRVLDEALEQLGVLREDLERRLEEGPDGATSKLEPDVLVWEAQRTVRDCIRKSGRQTHCRGPDP